jgi:hypothetical protein
MLPLCSICISLHNEDHKELKTHGRYVNLYQLIRDTVQAMEEWEGGLEEMSGEYV